MTDNFIKRFDTMIEAGELKHDVAQIRVAGVLQALHETLRQPEPNGKGLFGQLFGARAMSDNPKGIYIHGDVGRGKSMLMDLFFETAPVTAKRRVHFHEFMQDVHEDIHDWRSRNKKDDGGAKDPIAPVADKLSRDARLLCFDEFQVSDIADAMILGRLFANLFEAGTIVVATSNRPLDELYENGLNRGLFLPFIDMFKSHVDVLELDGTVDYRLDRLAGLDVYHTPLGDVAAGKMRQAWRRLTDLDEGKPCQLPVKGRTLDVPQAARGVARFTFAQLCEQPLGVADYLKLAHNFHTVLIDDIPVLRAARRNVAKRFMMLIDALYENRVKLIVSAQAEPEALYPQGKDAFELKRTISRLREMQSAEYLALGHGV